jgi:putative ABC transport system ATP-binding protein
MIILEAKNLIKSFNGIRKVLDGINISVEKGDFISILGASGNGKSTLLTILGGMDRPDAGEVFLNGVDLCALKEKELAKLRRTQIGFVFQFFNLAPYLSVEENILLPAFFDGKGKKNYEEKLNYLLDYLKIADLRNKMPSKLSGGEQQRVAIARGLIYEPDIIFLDEPTGNLDSKSAEEIMELLKKINSETGTTIIQVTHSRQNASYGNRIVYIKDGSIEEANTQA